MIAGGLDDIYATAGDAVLFIARDGTQTAVTAIVIYDLAIYGEVADISAVTAAVSVRKAELALSPLRGEIYRFNGRDYVVDEVVAEDDLEHTATVA
jgi:hypothetical protein